jgi:hypothetical protein
MEKLKKLNKKTIIIGSVIAILLIGGIVIYRRRKKKKDSENKQPETTKEVATTETKPTEETPTAKVEAPKQKTAEDILNGVLKNTLGKGSLKTNDKGVKFVELVINDPNKKPYTWKFFGNSKYEVFDNKNVLAFSGYFRNNGLRQVIQVDNYEFGTANLAGTTVTSNTLEEIAKRMFTLKP